jgi:hypothetical protein
MEKLLSNGIAQQYRIPPPSDLLGGIMGLIIEGRLARQVPSL